MIRKKAELTVNHSADYRNEIVKALKNAGFVVILEHEGFIEDSYIVAKEDEGKENSHE